MKEIELLSPKSLITATGRFLEDYYDLNRIDPFQRARYSISLNKDWDKLAINLQSLEGYSYELKTVDYDLPIRKFEKISLNPNYNFYYPQDCMGYLLNHVQHLESEIVGNSKAFFKLSGGSIVINVHTNNDENDELLRVYKLVDVDKELDKYLNRTNFIVQQDVLDKATEYINWYMKELGIADLDHTYFTIEAELSGQRFIRRYSETTTNPQIVESQIIPKNEPVNKHISHDYFYLASMIMSIKHSFANGGDYEIRLRLNKKNEWLADLVPEKYDGEYHQIIIYSN